MTELPLDYTVTIAEDFYVDDIVETLILTDVFSVGPYEITLYAGILFSVQANCLFYNIYTAVSCS